MNQSASIPASYISIQGEQRIEYIIDKSRFIATACPCETEEEAQAFIARIQKEFWDATHNCTAYALGPNQEQQRSSDNGEPSGTAGKPILEVLKKMKITNTAIVVTRYFGGIKLGAGGLIRAYSHSAAEVLHSSSKLEHAPRLLLTVTLSYPIYNTLERFLQDEGYTYHSQFEAEVYITIYLKPEEIEKLETEVTNLTHGQVVCERGPIEMVTLPI